jgi:hypothetical protein
MLNIPLLGNILSLLADRSSKPVLIKYDPRNLSRVFYKVKDGHYWPISYRNLRIPLLNPRGSGETRNVCSMQAISSDTRAASNSAQASEDSSLPPFGVEEWS